ncbi:hypothetical protein FV933_08210 [Campylobacter jejuni]|nr:hypothetical protein [Campylobacter jejuni]HED5415942.1 hypothetical protein [Campylobacter jejuni]HEF7505719.1 hypothetical protein [Campylobacter jejuni]
MAKTINKDVLNSIRKGAEMQESKTIEFEGNKNFTISFKVSQYNSLKEYCEKNHTSMGKLIKDLLKEKKLIN